MTEPADKKGYGIGEMVAYSRRLVRWWSGIGDAGLVFKAAFGHHSRRIGAGLAGLATIGTILGGLSGYWSAYKVLISDRIGQNQTVAEVPRLSIVVLPFENLTGNSELGFFCDAIVDNLTTDLSTRMPEATVIASAASLGYKGRPVDPRKVGSQLNVRYLLSGAVLRVGSAVRINARLIDSKDGRELWAEHFEGEFPDLSNVQDQVTSRISNSLQYTLPAVCIRRTEKPEKQDAFENLLRGKVALNDERRRGINPRREAERFLRMAILLQPENSEIQTELGLVLAENLFISRLLPPELQPSEEEARTIRREASELIDEATRFLPTTSDARLARALLSLVDHDFESARLQLEHTRSLNPNDYMVLYFLSLSYQYLGRPAEALPLFQEIYLRTAGRVPAYHIILLAWGRMFLLLGKWDDAIAKLKEAHALRPSPATNEALAIAYVERGDLGEARSHFKLWYDWHLKQFGVPTTKRLATSLRQLSSEPGYLELVNATYLDGYRKLGISDE
jgi:TolB-like protein/Flp pilus assembly protein TadD